MSLEIASSAFGAPDEADDFFDLANADDDMFEAALSAARAEGDLSRENVAQKIADQGARPRAVVRTFADVVPERISYLWPGRFPLGKLVVLDGDPSVGKSTLTIDLAARVSTGARWPDGAAGTAPGGVLILSAEDGLADTIAPRLHAARANLTRVHALVEIPLINEEGAVRMTPPSLPRDIAVIEQLVVQHEVKLVIIDVLMAYLSGGVDSHRDQDVRGVLHLLAAMAERTGCCVLLIRHLNKAGSGSPLYRGGGSIGIIGAARAGYLVARDPDDSERRIFAVTKLNIAIEPPSLAYRLVSDVESGCARVEWEADPVGLAAADLLRSPLDEDDRAERDLAAEWLADYLASNGGEAPAKDVFAAGKRENNFSIDTLKRAKPRAGVASVKAGFGTGWVWRLDHEGSTKGAKNADTESPLPSLASSRASHDRQRCNLCGEPLDPALGDVTTHPGCAA